MDGYAIRLSGKNGVPLVLPISGRTCAGDKPDVLAPGTAHRVMTGADRNAMHLVPSSSVGS